MAARRIRFFLLRTHYRSTIVFGEEGLREAATALETFTGFFERYQRIADRCLLRIAPHPAARARGLRPPDDPSCLAEISRHRSAFLAKMDDDFNTGAAISDLFELVRILNKFADRQQLEDRDGRDPADLAIFERGMSTLRELTALLGLFLQPPATDSGQDQQLVDQLMMLLVELRAHARSSKDFATADRIRDGLKEIGITLEDRKEGTGWRLP